MPITYYAAPLNNRKKFKLLLLLLLSPLFFYAQSSLTGLWVGSLSSDSTTVRKDQSFEIALTEYKGKVYGYSRSEFIVDDVLYYIVKRVKGTIEGNVCEVTDDEIVSYNFPKKLEKNIKVTSTFRRNSSDSIWHLDGKWKTNATKKYYSVSGKVALESEPDLTASKIFPHLEELNLADDVAFYKERKEGQPIIRIAKPEKVDPGYAARTEKLSVEKDASVSSNNKLIQNIDPAYIPVKPVVNNRKQLTATSDRVTINNKAEKNELSKEPAKIFSNSDQKDIVVADKKNDVKTKVIAKTETPAKNNQEVITSTTVSNTKVNSQSTTPADKKNEMNTEVVANNNNTKPNNSVTPARPITTQPEIVSAKADSKNTPSKISSSIPIKPNAAKEDAIVKTDIPAETKQIITPPVTQEIKTPTEDITLKAAVIAGRKSEFSQIVNFKSDSLQIALYDNGEIDGDTVSVFMNGEVILARQGLKSSAIRKTIYLPSGQTDEFTLVMFAESLGKYPPNTGLLVIRDGDDIYNLRFSSDFQKNAGIVFRRKK